MQNKKIIVYGFYCVVFFFCTGFFGGNQSFKKAIAKHKNSTLTYLPEIGKGLPYFTPKTLTPTWKNSEGVKIPNFQLVDQNGFSRSEEIFNGKVSVVSFIFTSCAGFCPLLVRKLKILEKNNPKDKSLQFVLITVDPEVDRPERLQVYRKNHGLNSERWVLLTGSKSMIYDLSRKTFASEVRRIDKQNMRAFAHTEHFYVIDKERRLRSILNGTRKDMLQHYLASVRALNKAL